MMKIKVCGITTLEQLKAIDSMNVDYAGMIFYPQSKRYVLNKLNGREIRDSNLTIKKVGVFVNAPEENIMTMIEQYELDMVQLHGDETPAFCKHISNRISVMKAFRINEKNENNIDWMIKPFEEYVDHYLFDTYSKSGYGGTGEKFNWSALKDSVIDKPFFLSGGIGVEEMDAVGEFKHPFFYGIDLNSKVETEPGIKDIKKIKTILTYKNSIVHTPDH